MTIDQLCAAVRAKKVGEYVVYPLPTGVTYDKFSDANARSLKGQVHHNSGLNVDVYKARGEVRVKRLAD